MGDSAVLNGVGLLVVGRLGAECLLRTSDIPGGGSRALAFSDEAKGTYEIEAPEDINADG